MFVPDVNRRERLLKSVNKRVLPAEQQQPVTSSSCQVVFRGWMSYQQLHTVSVL